VVNTATSPRDLIVQVIAEADRHLSSSDHYEQQADAVLAVVGPEIKSLLDQIGQLKAQNNENIRAVGVALAQVGRERDVARDLLRGMARRVGEWRRTSAKHYAEFHQALQDWQSNDEQVLADSQRLAEQVEKLTAERDERQTAVERVLTEKDDQRWQLAKAISAATDLPWDELIVETRRVTEEWLARGTTSKPNPWFTPAEFPLEEAERADRERPSIAYAFPTQEWREEQLNGQPPEAEDPDREGPFVPDIVTALSQVRDLQIESNSVEQVEGVLSLKHQLDQVEKMLRHYEKSLTPVSEARHRLLTGEWPEAEPRPICGQVHDSVPCTEPRVPETNGCWAHYGPEVEQISGVLDEALELDAPTVRTDRAEGCP
jgi:chromosome segregation ATPase